MNVFPFSCECEQEGSPFGGGSIFHQSGLPVMFCCLASFSAKGAAKGFDSGMLVPHLGAVD